MIVKYIRLRHRLLPYVYSTAWQTYRDGIPMLRPLFLDFPGDRSLYTTNRQALQDQFLFGDAFLVAPLVDAGTARPVWLPPGSWYGFHDGKTIPSGALQASLPSGDLPVYVRGGAIIPWDEDMDGHVDTIRLYTGPEASTFTWYEDDGISNDFRKGKFEAIEIRLDAAGVSFDGVKTARRLKLIRIAPGGTREYPIDLPAGTSRTAF
jgi:alpha-glucosidase (family GH31 glycosyl hydrolase)